MQGKAWKRLTVSSEILIAVSWLGVFSFVFYYWHPILCSRYQQLLFSATFNHSKVTLGRRYTRDGIDLCCIYFAGSTGPFLALKKKSSDCVRCKKLEIGWFFIQRFVNHWGVITNLRDFCNTNDICQFYQRSYEEILLIILIVPN